MTFEQFENLAKTHSTIPVYTRVLADMLTPVSTYMRFQKDSNYAFILESVEKGEQYARYSFIGRNPDVVLRSDKGQTIIEKNSSTSTTDTDYLTLLREYQSRFNAPQITGLPTFTGGLVGCLGYESIVWVEDIPTYEDNILDTPDAVFMLYNNLIAFDHLKNEAILFSNVHICETTDLKQAYHEAIRQIDLMGELLHTDIDYQTPIRVEKSSLKSNFTKDKFMSSVQKAQEYIKSGDVFQLVLSQRFHRHTPVDAITLYRALRTINPSPYMFHLKLNGIDVIGASPELLVKVQNREVEIRPIAGTRQRGQNAKEDAQLAQELLNDTKERAEHLMLVDLGRNDVGRCTEYESVKVKDFMIVENYSHVMHIVSDVRGTLMKDKDNFDALYSGFPAGTLTGAPKIRAMEIIHELEPDRRGIYSGAIGYFDFAGNMNTCIAIRTLVLKDNIAYFQSGAGIVFDSNPELEYEETLNKAKAINSAIDLAENGLI